MKHWDDLTPAEREERFGDTRIIDVRAEYEADLVRRYLANLPLSLDGKRRARQLIKASQ